MKKAYLIALVISCVTYIGVKKLNARATEVETLQDAFKSVSHIKIPIRINLNLLEEHIEAEIPENIFDIDERPICIKAKWLKTKVPYFKGWKLYSRMLKTKISPEVKCDVKGWVRRDGQVNITGFDSTFRIAVPIKAKISGKVSGISETAVARATVYFDVTPTIDEDWNLDLQVSSDFSWSQRPTLKLFNIVKITIGSRVEPKLNGMLEGIAKDMPKFVTDLNLRDRMERVWTQAQSPVVLNKEPQVSVVYRPISASHSGFSISDNTLKTSFMTTGSTFVYLNDPRIVPEVTPLAQLDASTPARGSFELSVPIFLPYEGMTRIVRKEFPEGHIIEFRDIGVITLSNPIFGLSDSGKLRVSIDLSVDRRSRLLSTVDVFGWFTSVGTLTFEGVPKIDESTKTLSVQELEYVSVSNSKLQDAIVEGLGLKPIKSYIESLANYKFGEDIDRAVDFATAAMNTELEEGILLSGILNKASIVSIELLAEQLLVRVQLSGTAQIDVGM